MELGRLKEGSFKRQKSCEVIPKAFDTLDNMAISGCDENNNIIYWNLGCELLYGYSPEEAINHNITDLIVPEQMHEVYNTLQKQWIKSNTPSLSSEMTLCHKNGEAITIYRRYISLSVQANNKQTYCIDLALTDVKKAQSQTLNKEHMLDAVFEATPDIFFLMKEDGTIIDYHTNQTKNLYHSPSEFIGKSMVEILPLEVAKKLKKHLQAVLHHNGIERFEYELEMPHGLSYFEARISYLPKHKQIVTIVREITEEYKSSEAIRHRAYFDTLTKIPNRLLSLDRLSQMVKEAERANEKAAILFIDLDDFKKVNDALGHDVGDKVLIESAKRLENALRKEDTVGRLGGDEFIILLRDLNEDHNTLSIAENLLNIFRKPFLIDDRELTLTLSIGIAIYPENGHNTSDLLRNADAAMYKAKALGRNTYSFFTKAMNEAMLRRLSIEEQMHKALERKELEVYYQPKFDIKDGNIIGAEALVRWRNTSLGNIGPDEFIPIAEHTGLIMPIGQYVIKEALTFLARWQKKHQRKYTMAINLSPRQFRDKDLLPFIQTAIKRAKIHKNTLEFEITEGVLMTGQSCILEIFTELNKAGITFSMDDFGTGYSSLSYLRQYPFDILKIDRTFIKGITLQKKDRDLVKATIAMAHSLGLSVIAEGVEISEQLNLLEELKCDFIQGNYFCKPLPPEKLIKFSACYNLGSLNLT